MLRNFIKNIRTLCLMIVVVLTNLEGSQTVNQDNFISLNNGNQNELIYSANVTKEWMSKIHENYNWDNYDEYLKIAILMTLMSIG